MNLRRRIRDYLGINDLFDGLAADRDLSDAVRSLSSDIYKLAIQVQAQQLGIGRIIAKLDPAYGGPEIDPTRRAESDKLGKQVIERLAAEAEIHKRYRYTP